MPTRLNKLATLHGVGLNPGGISYVLEPFTTIGVASDARCSLLVVLKHRDVRRGVEVLPLSVDQSLLWLKSRLVV
ncbi:hypothetical protein LF1_43440 [Rubripirellula obstinata]|uniref:Uncharacterized protein n=1 Tax=Rubripirellula obstinata TaxID=406547 RepID=A0A5B1CRA8_9BACT|nr:hypothetical protein LF1_43440 [Rubripirellula obstinata]